jgi:hypothetical protein
VATKKVDENLHSLNEKEDTWQDPYIWMQTLGSKILNKSTFIYQILGLIADLIKNLTMSRTKESDSVI